MVPSAIVRTFGGIRLSVVVGEVDFVVVVRRRLAEAWLLRDFVFFDVVEEGLDCLPLGEDAMGELWVTTLVPPSSFLWSTVVESGFVHGDSRWVVTLPLLVRVVVLDGVADRACSWVTDLKVLEVRH